LVTVGRARLETTVAVDGEDGEQAAVLTGTLTAVRRA